MTLEIRFAEAADEAQWRPLWQGYLTFYEAGCAGRGGTRHTLARILDPAERVAMRVALIDGKMVGFANHHHHDSTWDIAHDCYLEDLYVERGARGHGVGRALIEDLKALCKARGWNRLYWHTNETNARRPRAL